MSLTTNEIIYDSWTGKPIEPSNEEEEAAYLTNALEMAALNVPVFFIDAGTKIANAEAWPNICTTSPEKIRAMAAKEPGKTNYGCVSKAVVGGLLTLDDDGGIRQEYEKLHGPLSPTLKARSCNGAFHYYLRHSAKSVAYCEHTGKKRIQETRSDGGGELWSLRMDNSYVIGPGSVVTRKDGAPGEYKIVWNAPIIEIPDSLLHFLIARYDEGQQRQAKTVSTNPDVPLLLGSRNNGLASVAGRLRRAGSNYDEILNRLLRENQERCEPPLETSEVETIAASISKYTKGDPTSESVFFNGVAAGIAAPRQSITAEAVDEIHGPDWQPDNLDTTASALRPVFPSWIMRGTTLFDGLVEPAVQLSSKYPEFIWMPGLQLMLNLLNRKVDLKQHTVNLNLYLGMISPYGKFFKSSSCELAHKYFIQTGLVAAHKQGMTNADGKVIIYGGAGSPEGFGKNMASINGRNAVLYSDELEKLISKSRIESSSFGSDLLTWYESGPFENIIKSVKDSYSFEAQSYTFGWSFCVTDRAFTRLWGKISGIASGIEDRMFFLVSQKEPRTTTLYQDPCFSAAWVRGRDKTAQAIHKAIEQRFFDFADIGLIQSLTKKLENNPRAQQLLLKFALYFAVDLGLDEISEDCCERAAALTKFSNDAVRFLDPIEAEDPQGRLQKAMTRELRRHGGKMPRREFCREMGYRDYGADFWERAEAGMVRNKTFVYWTVKMPSGQKVKMIGLLKDDD